MTSSDTKVPVKKVPGQRIDLFLYSEEQLMEDLELTHYEILNCPEFATQEEIKKAYRKASLKYHPDKTGRDSEDYIFLAVKGAHDVLFDPLKRQAYDSTTMPFDDGIPNERAKMLDDPKSVPYTHLTLPTTNPC